MGDDTDPWGEITRLGNVDGANLEALPIDNQILSGMSGWFQNAPELKTEASISASKNLYSLRITSQFNTNILQGSILPGGLKGEIRFNFNGSGLSVASSLKKINPKIALSPNAIWIVVSFIGSQGFMTEINSQFEQVNEKLDDIKEFLEQKEFSSMQGNLAYLDTIRTALASQKVSDQDIEAYRNQLEEIDRETFQSLSLIKARMDGISKQFKDVQLDKTLFIFPNDSRLEEMNARINDFNKYGNFYLVALEVHTISAQLRAALPSSRDLALTKLNNVKSEVADWKTQENNFYGIVNSRSAEILDKYNKKDSADQFKKIASDGISFTSQNKVDDVITIAIASVQGQINNFGNPLDLVVELDSTGNVVKLSKIKGQ